MRKYILALDEGTTSARAILFDREGKICRIAQYEFEQYYPEAGWVEQNAEEMYNAQYKALLDCIDGINPEEIAGIGITNQRETTVVWEKGSGKPIYNAIVWQCRRTAEMCDALVAGGHGDYIKEATGLHPDAYFSATKIKWLLDNAEGARDAAKRGDLLFGTVDTWLIWKLTGGKTYVTDYTNASRTMLFNINTFEWDKKILDLLGIPDKMLPEVKSSSEIYGYADIKGCKIPVCGIAGDQQAALFGQKCFGKGDAKTTYGTGCFLLVNTGCEKVTSTHGLITTLAATEKNRKPEYALEGSVFIGGAIIKWLRDKLCVISSAAESEAAARKVPDSNGVYIVPAFSGLGAPYWDRGVKGNICGLTLGTDMNHIIRASLEAIAYQTEDLIDAMEADLGEKMTCLKADGGASVNSLLMQFQADISELCVSCPEMAEATALGAAFLAGLACGFWRDRNELCTVSSGAKEYRSGMDSDKREDLLDGWHRAVKSCRAFK